MERKSDGWSGDLFGPVFFRDSGVSNGNQDVFLFFNLIQNVETLFYDIEKICTCKYVNIDNM